MPKLRELIQTPPEPEGGAEEQLEALRDYLRKVTQELEYLLTHLEADNINDTTFERISEMIPRPYTGLPLMDGEGSAGTSANWSRGNHRHPHDDSKADVTALENHKADKANPHEVTKAQVGLGNVANERQYSAQNPPPIPTPGEVGAVPVTREINGHALSADVTLDHTDVGAIPATEKGSAGGVAELDSSGHVPSSQLPSYVDDVKEYPSVTDFPIPGVSDKIYIALDTDLFYRWGGTVYAPTNPSLALGETSSTAYRGDRGKTAYDHSQLASGNPHNVSASDVGLGNVANERQYSAQNPPPLPTPADIGAATAQDLSDHVGDTANPHGVTAAQVGARPDDWAPDAEDVPYDNTQSGLTATDVQAAIDELAQSGGGGGPSPSDANPQMDGTAAPGTALTYARGDHVHPTDTSRAAAALEINGHPLTGDFDLAASDVGALASGGTAVAARTLAPQHKIFGSGMSAGWYAFAEISISNNLSRIYDILIDSTYHLSSTTYRSGILRVYFSRSGTGVNTANVKWLASQFPLDNVRWAAESVSGSGKLTLYIYKEANSSGSLTFRCMSATDREGDAVAPPTWVSTAVAEPMQATAASGYLYNQAASAVNDGNGNNIADGVLWYSSVAVSAGVAQQILSISDAKITADYVLARIEWTNPSYITAGYTWTTGTGSFTLSGTATAATTANVLLLRR